MTRLRLALFSLLFTALFAGCGIAPRLAYNHLDRLLLLELDDYVDLDAAQERALRGELTALWRWHRREALMDYAVDLEAFAKGLDSGNPDRAAVERAADQLLAHGERLRREAAPRLAKLLPQLSEAQVADILAERRKTLFKSVDKNADETVRERDERLQEKAEDEIEDWIGALLPVQRVLVTRTVADAERRGELSTAAQRELAENRLAALEKLLSSRKEAGLEARIIRYGKPEGAAAEALAAQRRARGRQAFAELGSTLDARQRTHLAERLRGLAEDCRKLAVTAQTP